MPSIFYKVYDGPTVDSPVLLQKSGSPSTQITVISTSNKMIVRLVSERLQTRQGFIAIYSSIN